MRKLFAVMIVAALSFMAIPSLGAQELDFEIQAGGGYLNQDEGAFGTDNLLGSFYMSGVSLGRFGGGALYELSYADGELGQRVFARGEGTVMGPTYAAIDVALNGDWDPRAVFGFVYEQWTFEGYSQIDGDIVYGFAIRWKLF